MYVQHTVWHFRESIKGCMDEKESICIAIEILAGIDNNEGCNPPQVYCIY